jgi:hypothetical protein
MGQPCAVIRNLFEAFNVFSELGLDIALKENSCTWLDAGDLSGTVHY